MFIKLFTVALLCGVLAAQDPGKLPPLPSDTTAEYAISAAQRQRLTAAKAAVDAALRQHNQEAFSRAHHQWWATCNAVKAEIHAPVTAVCDYDTSLVKGKDAKIRSGH